jgi:MFS family permease
LEQRYVALTVCSAIWFTHNFVSNSLSVLLPLVTKEFALSYSETGILATSSLAVFALMQLPTGYLVSRTGSKKIMVFGIAFLSTFNILVSTAASYTQFLAFHMLRAIGSGCHLTVGTAFISNLFGAAERGKAIGTHESAVSLAGLLSPIATVPLALQLSWRTTYLIYGTAGLAIALAAWISLPNIETSEAVRASESESRQKPSNAKILMLLLILTIHAFVFHAISTFLPLYLSAEKQILLIYLGYYVAVPSLLGLFGRPLGGHLSDKIGRRSMTLISLASLASGITLTVLTSGGYMLILSLALLGFGLHTVIPVLFAFLMDMFHPSRRALIAGRINTVRHLIAGTSPTIVGAIADSIGFSTAFLVLAFAVVTNLLVALRMPTEKS